MGNARILIIEEERVISEYLCDSIQQRGYEVIGTAKSIAEAVERFHTARPDLIIVDAQLAGYAEMAQDSRTIREQFHCKIPVIFLTTSSSIPSRTQESEIFLRKPFSERELHAAIERGLSTFYAS